MAMRCMMALGIGLLAAAAAAQDAPGLKSHKDKVSYALGLDLGNQLRKLSVELDPVLVGQGLKDSLSGSKALLTKEEADAAVSELRAEMKLKEARARRGLEGNKAAEDNKKAGEAFLAENSKKEGVVTLASGLQYKVLKAAEGTKPTLDDTVLCHYRATFLDGTEFFNSYKRDQQMPVSVKESIKGLTEALQLMPVGSKWQLFMPPELAYGEIGSGPVGPNATLIYEVELLSIQSKP